MIKCSEADLAKDLSGKVYIVTGANGGVGFETAKQLVIQGGHVVMAVRRVKAGEQAAEQLKGLKGSTEVMKCDLSDLVSVRSFAEAFQKKYDHLDGLLCNAGMLNWDNKYMETKDGFEVTWAASYFGHFLLTELLLDLLKKSAPSRIAIVSSGVLVGSEKKRPAIHFEDLQHKNRKYDNQEVYAEVKLATAMYMYELAKRLEGTGVTTASIHPGWAKSNFGYGGSKFNVIMMKALTPLMAPMMDSTWDSAQTSLHVLLNDDVPNHSGEYFSQYSMVYSDKECKKGGYVSSVVGIRRLKDIRQSFLHDRRGYVAENHEKSFIEIFQMQLQDLIRLH